MKKVFIAAGVVFLVSFLVFSAEGRILWQSAFILPDLVPGSSFRPLDMVTDTPHKETVSIKTSEGTLDADVYTSASGKTRGAILLISGASAMGKNDPRIMNFGETLARVGAAVVIPNFPDITAERFATTSVPEVVSAYEYIENRFPDGKNGMTAFSIATGPMFMAAADPSIAADIRYLVSLGGYDDMKEVIRNATTAPGRDMTEAAEIRDIFLDHFGPDARMSALLENTDPAKFDALYQVLDPRVKAFISGVSPAPYLSEIKAPKILLLHSDPDPDVPTGESIKLKNILGDRAELILLKTLSHTDVKFERFTPVTLFSFYIPEVWKLYRVAYKVLTF